jgi:hypothetical protein
MEYIQIVEIIADILKVFDAERPVHKTLIQVLVLLVNHKL